ncbi:MAG: hypothetical protein ACRDYU_08735 [Actinomycetes bacterium]
MYLIAVLFIGAGVAATVGLVLGGNTDTASLVAFGYPLPQMTTVEVFAAGAGAMLLVLLGVSMMRAAIRRAQDLREDMYYEDEQEAALRRLERQNADLQQQLGHARDPYPPAYSPYVG